MGLDIHVLQNVRRSDAEVGGESTLRVFHVSPRHFLHASAGLEPGKRYVGEPVGPDPSRSWPGWVCCAYSSWNRYRDILSRALLGRTAAAVWEECSGNPKYRLENPVALVVDFTDCDGVLSADALRLAGPAIVSARAEVDAFIDAAGGDADWMKTIHGRFVSALEKALSIDGAVLLFA